MTIKVLILLLVGIGMIVPLHLELKDLRVDEKIYIIFYMELYKL